MINVLLHNLLISKMYKFIEKSNIMYKINIYHSYDNIDTTKLNFSNNFVNFVKIDTSYKLTDHSLLSYVTDNNIKFIITTNLLLNSVHSNEFKNKAITVITLRSSNLIDSVNKFVTELTNIYINIYTNSSTGSNTSNKDNNTSNKANNTNVNKVLHLKDKTKNAVIINPKETFRSICYQYIDYMRYIELPIIQRNNSYEAVLIEYSCLPHIEFLVRNCINKLGDKWSHTIVCGNLNYEYMLNIINTINRNIKLIKTDYDTFIPDDYNKLLASHYFWDLLVGEKIFIYQEDSIIFKNNIEDFLQWDYIGAPFPKEQNDTPNCVGNGSFSLRTKSIMKEILNRISHSETVYNSSTQNYMNNCNLTYCPEDVYFSKNMQDLNIGIVADWDTSSKFSSMIYSDEESFGANGIWINDTNLLKKRLHKSVVPVLHMNRFKTEHRGGWNLVQESFNKTLIDNNSDILFIDYVDCHFLFFNKNRVITKKWIGIIHFTPITPSYLDSINVRAVLYNQSFLDSVNSCLYIITLSNYVKNFLDDEFKKLNLHIKVYSLKHPTEINVPLFNLDNYIRNQNKSLIQIGQQLRKITSIYRVNTNLNKIWLTGTKDISASNSKLIHECNYFGYNDINLNSVTMKYLNTFVEFDYLLSINIVFIDLFDSGANNTLVECIARNTPIIINRTEGVVEYLGNDYPLYFENIEEVTDLLTIENISKAHTYMQKLDKDYLNVNYFKKQFINILNNEICLKK